MKLLYILIVFCLTGCYSANLMQTAKTLEKGKQELTVGAVGNFVEGGDFGTGVGPDVMYRRGIMKRGDIGISYAPSLAIGNLRADFKYNFWKSRDQNRYVSTLISAEAHNVKEIYSGLALIASFNHSKNIHPYIYHKFTLGYKDIKVFSIYDNEIPSTQREWYNHKMFFIGGVGFRYQLKKKPRTQFFLEGGFNFLSRVFYQNSHDIVDDEKEWYIYKFKSNDMNYHITLGFSFKLGK